MAGIVTQPFGRGPGQRVYLPVGRETPAPAPEARSRPTLLVQRLGQPARRGRVYQAAPRRDGTTDARLVRSPLLVRCQLVPRAGWLYQPRRPYDDATAAKPQRILFAQRAGRREWPGWLHEANVRRGDADAAKPRSVLLVERTGHRERPGWLHRPFVRRDDADARRARAPRLVQPSADRRRAGWAYRPATAKGTPTAPAARTRPALIVGLGRRTRAGWIYQSAARRDGTTDARVWPALLLCKPPRWYDGWLALPTLRRELPAPPQPRSWPARPLQGQRTAQPGWLYVPSRNRESEPIVTGVICLALANRSSVLSLDVRSLGFRLDARSTVVRLDERSLYLTLEMRSLYWTLPQRPTCTSNPMATERREFKESAKGQGESETLAYKFLTTPWGSSPGSVVTTCKDVTAGGMDVSGTVLSGSNAVNGDEITMKKLGGLTKNHTYRLECQFQTADGNIWEAFGFIVCTE